MCVTSKPSVSLREWRYGARIGRHPFDETGCNNLPVTDNVRAVKDTKSSVQSGGETMSDTGGHEVDPRELRAYANYVGDLSGSVYTIQLSAMFEGMNSTGFTGLLTPIGVACDEVRESILRPVFEMIQTKLHQTGEGVRVAAYKYGLEEIESQERIERTGKGGGPRAV